MSIHEECGVFGVFSPKQTDIAVPVNAQKNRFEKKLSEVKK